MRLDKVGALHPTRDFRGDARYDPDEVNAYAVSHPRHGRRIFDDGELTAEFAKLMAQGKGRRDAVMELRITFARADELHAEWMRGNEFAVAQASRMQEHARNEERRALAARERERERRRVHVRQVMREALKGLRREPTR